MNTLRKQKYIYFTLILFLFLNIQGKADQAQKNRPIKWAVAVSLPGVANFYKVSDVLYRGAQPEEKGIAELQKLGIKTIVNFRHSKKDVQWVKGTNLNYYQLTTSAEFPSKKKFRRFLAIMANPANWPVFVHCKHGSDRTGVAIALYRVKIQKWTVTDALDEMVHGGYGFHKIYYHLKEFVEEF